MKQFEFHVVFLDRIELREPTSEATIQLNALGKQGWHVVHVKEDPQHNRDLLIFMEREISA